MSEHDDLRDLLTRTIQQHRYEEDRFSSTFGKVPMTHDSFADAVISAIAAHPDLIIDLLVERRVLECVPFNDQYRRLPRSDGEASGE